MLQGPAGSCALGLAELQKGKVLIWILVLNLWWVEKSLRVLVLLSWQEATRSTSSWVRDEAWRKEEMGMGTGTAAHLLPQPGSPRQSEGTWGGRHEEETLTSPSAWGPQPDTLFHTSEEHPREAGTTEDANWGYWEPWLSRASLAWGFASLAGAGCGQCMGSEASRGQSQRVHGLGPPQPSRDPQPSHGGTGLKGTQPHNPDTP